MNFALWLENDNAQDLLRQVVFKVFGQVNDEAGVYWIPFLDKTIYVELKNADNISEKPYVIVAFFNTDDLGANLSTVALRMQQSTMPLMRKLQEFGGQLSRVGLRMIYTADKKKVVGGVEKDAGNQRARVFDKVFGKAGMRKIGVVRDDDDDYHVWEFAGD